MGKSCLCIETIMTEETVLKKGSARPSTAIDILDRMTTVKPFARTDFDHLLHSFVDENQFPWLDPSLHERYVTCRTHWSTALDEPSFLLDN